MARESNLQIVRSYGEEAWGPGRPFAPDVLRRYLSPGFKRYTAAAAPPLDREGQIERLQGFARAFPDLHITPDQFVAEGDTVATRGTLRATHEGEFLGIPATGRSVAVTLVDFIRLEDGRFVEQWGGPDTLDLLRQLGATVRPPG